MFPPVILVSRSQICELITIAKALKILVSKGDVKVHPCMCVELDSINALAWVVGAVEVRWKIKMAF